MLFIKDEEKFAVADQIIAKSGHIILPISDQLNRFLATPRERRVDSMILQDSLLDAGVKTVDTLTYAQKSPLDAYKNMHLLACDIEYDIGKYVVAGLEGKIAVVGCSSIPTLTGRIRTRRMFSDLLQSLGNPPAGTVEWSGVSSEEGVTYNKIKLYPVFVHYLKAKFPANLFDLPKTNFGLKRKLSIMSNVATDVAIMCESETFSQIRVEMSLCIPGGSSMRLQELATRTPAILNTVLMNTYVVRVNTEDYVKNLRSWLDRAAMCNLSSGRDGTKLSSRKVCHLQHLMNECGIATDSVLKELEIRHAGARFQWEYAWMPPASPAIPLSAAAQGLADSVDDVANQTHSPSHHEFANDALVMQNIRRRVKLWLGGAAQWKE
jgi:hypothetical protein